MATITVMPNQSMQDVIVQAMGSLEGGMCFCSLNNVSVSDTPAVGTMYDVPDGSQSVGVTFESDTMADSGVLHYLSQNGIVIGNLGTIPIGYITEDGTENFVTEDGSENFVTE